MQIHNQVKSRGKRQVRNPESALQTKESEKEQFADYYDWDNDMDKDKESDNLSTECNFNGNHIKYFGTNY